MNRLERTQEQLGNYSTTPVDWEQTEREHRRVGSIAVEDAAWLAGMHIDWKPANLQARPPSLKPADFCAAECARLKARWDALHKRRTS